MSTTTAQDSGAPVVLSLKGINKSFPGRKPGLFRKAPPPLHVLKDVSLDIHAGEVVVVIGPSGSGKSTLLRCANLLTVPDQGSLSFAGRSWDFPRPRGFAAGRRFETDLRELRKQVGMVFQHFNLFPHKTALGNVMLAQIRVLGRSREEARRIALEELERVGLADKAGAYPGQLSGGQKQRVAIARSLAMRPRMILFDEATSALDPEIVEEILGQMRRLASDGMTMMVVTHEMSFAREVGDRIVFMDQGRIIEEGPARQLLSQPQNPRTQSFLRSIL